MKKDFEENLIKNLSKFFKKERGVLFCYLFGSRAYKEFISTSDIDLAVYLDEKKCRDFFEKRLELISQISQILRKDADILVLNTTSPFLKYVVLKEGKLIYERNQNKRIDFELKAINEYFDYKPILERYHQKLLAS